MVNTGSRRPRFPAARKQRASFSPGPLDELRTAMRRNVEMGALPGCAHLVMKDGQCIFAHAEGWSDIEAGVRFSLDTLSPLHGATKPLVAAAFLTLVDDGIVSLSDPISKYMSFPGRFLVGKKGKTKRAGSAATVRHLLAMTAGVGYEDCPSYKQAMSKISAGKIDDLTSMCDALGTAPLQWEPGKRYHYSFSADFLGRLCEKVSGLPIDAFVRRKLLQPLGMTNTYFEQLVPPRKSRRVAHLYNCTTLGRKRKHSFRLQSCRWASKHRAQGVLSCGGGVLSYRDYGMVSTARDYARFCQMILSGGRAAETGRRVLKESTVRELWKDGLAPFQGKDGRLRGWNDADGPNKCSDYWDYAGWSLLNTHLTFDKGPKGGVARKGHTMWMGGGGGAFWSIDTRRGLATVSLTACLGGRSSEEDGMGPLANDASPFAAAAVDEARRQVMRKRKRA